MSICPLISIITVTYNAKALLERTILSVIEQNYENIEYIIIDGGSTDGTLEIIKKYEKEISLWVSEPDTGVYDAMNKAIDMASGEWINFLNAGDTFIDSNVLNKIMSYTRDNSDLIVGNINYISEYSERKIKAAGLAYAFDGMFCCHQALFTRMSIMKRLKFDTAFKIAADYDFVLKCYKDGAKFKFIDEFVVNYRAGGLSEQQVLLNKIESLFAQSRYLENIEDIYKSRSYSFLEDNNPYPSRQVQLSEVMSEFKRQRYDEMKFVLYGYGNIGRSIYTAYPKSVQAIVDINAAGLNTIDAPTIYPVEHLLEIEFDYILVSVIGREKEIQEFLLENNVPANKILLLNSCDTEAG